MDAKDCQPFLYGGLCCVLLVHSCILQADAVDPSTTTGCFVHTAMKHRAVKKGCRPLDITINGCWGRCDSYQIPELLPPYVNSVHPSCIHSDYTEMTILLPDCDLGVDPSYTYRDALECACQSITESTTAYDYRPDFYLL